VRDPRWGRNLECAGEDPLLSGEYAINFVQGFEHAKETSYPLQASACCKHVRTHATRDHPPAR
jgi:beta-glucosidase-like glycosyl hydrolase